MSYDRHLDQVCTHEVREEALFFGSDRKTVVPLRPISSEVSVRVRLNGEVLVPSWGYHIPAVAKGSRRGPFDIVSGVNDSIVLGLDGLSPRRIVVPPGIKVRADVLAQQLNASYGKALFSASGGRISVRSSAEGPQAILVIRPTALATSLGLVADRYLFGRTVCPGWSLVRNLNTLNDRPTKYIVFDEVLKGYQDFVEIDYTTVRQECRRCHGLGVENDWRYGKSGEVGQVRDEALLIQEGLKAIYTVQGSNVFHPWYGSRILNAIGQKQSYSGVVQNMISADIQLAFSRWQAVKKKQEEIGQVLSDEEYPFRLGGVSLERSDKDPTLIYVNVSVQSRSRKPIQITRGIKLPEPLNLMGDSAQTGAIRSSLAAYSSAVSLDTTTVRPGE